MQQIVTMCSYTLINTKVTIKPKNAVTMKIKMSYKPLLASQKEIQLPCPQFSTPKVVKSQTFIQIGSKLQSSANSKTTTTGSKITSAHRPLHRSQFSMRTQSETSDTPSTIAECIQQIREIQKHSCVNLHYMSQDTSDKIKTITDIINEMLPIQSAKLQNTTKIAQLTKQIIEEKAQKAKAIKSGQSLQMQQAEQIQQLKSRISLYQ